MDLITYALLKKKMNLIEGMKYKGSIGSTSELPTASQENKGWVYTLTSNGHEWVSDGTQWVDLSADLDDKYTKPATGIPDSDLEEDYLTVEDAQVSSEIINDADTLEGHAANYFIANPSGGTTGQVLKKTASASEWGDAPSGLPEITAQDEDKVLTVDDGAAVWKTSSGGGSTAGVVAPAYSTSSTYAVDDLVIYNNTLYRCISAITTAEAWTAAHWTSTVMSTEVNRMKTLTVTCVTQDSVAVTGQTVTVREGNASGNVYGTAAYNGQPVSFLVPYGFSYYVSVSDTLPSHFNPTTASGLMKTSTNITLTYSDFSTINSFTDIKAALNAGTDLTDLVGETVSVTRQGTQLVFDVVDYANNTVTVLLHDTLPEQMMFEPPQALAYFADGLAAGSYYWTNGSTNYYFTLANAIPAEGQLKGSTSSISSYASASTSTTIETVAVSTTAISGATSIGTIATNNLNHMDRVSYGSNNYGESAVFAWMNSDALPNTNIERVNKFARPFGSGNTGGLLNGFDANELAALDDSVWRQTACNVYEAPAAMGGIATKNTEYTVTGKFGLLNTTEVSGNTDATLDYYRGVDNTVRIKRYNNSARDWWLRLPFSSYAYREYYVSSCGAVDYYLAHYTFGVVPAARISKST